LLNDFDSKKIQHSMIREGLSYLVHGALLPFGYLESRHRPLRRRDLRTAVFIHGLAANRASLYPLQSYLRFNGSRRQYSFNYRSTGSIENLALKLKREIDENVKGGRIDIIAHSMGGLIARFYLQQLGGARRVDRLITLATPHCGTYSSAFIPTSLVRQLKPDGVFISYLNSLPSPEGLTVTSFGARDDVIILPAESSLCPFGDGHIFDNLGHISLLLSPRVFSAVGGALNKHPAVSNNR